MPLPARKRRPAKPEAKDQPRPFRDQRGGGDAPYPPAEAQHKPQVQRHVQPVHPQLQDQHAARPLYRDQPAGDGVKRDRRGRAPDADRQVVPRQRLYLGRGRGKAEGQPEDRQLQHDRRQPRRRPDHQRAGQKRAGFGHVARAMRLRDHAGGAHPQEAEYPVEGRQDHRAHAHRTDRRRQPHLPHDAGIDCAQKRHGRVRQHDGQRDLQDPPVRDLIHRRTAPTCRASKNARSPARKAAPGCPARPRHECWRNAGRNGSPAPAHRRRAAGRCADNRR